MADPITADGRARPGPSRDRSLEAVLALTAVAAALRCFRLEAQSFWYDEAVSASLSARPLWALATGAARDLGNPPLHNLLLHLWGGLFGRSDAALRALSATAGVASVPLLYGVGRRLLGDSRVALGAAAILALSPFHVYLGQETRTYTLATLLCLTSVDALLRALEASARGRRIGWWSVYGLSSFLAMYAHYFSAFVILAGLIWVLAWPPRAGARGGALAALIGAALLYGVWVPALLAQLGTQGNLGRSAESWHLHALATPLVFGVGTTLVWKDSATVLRLALAGVAALALGLPLALGLWRARKSRGGRLVCLWLALPLGLPLLISLGLFPFFNVRYVLGASPAYYLALALGLSALRPRLRAGVVGALAGVAAFSLSSYYTSTVKHDWRGAVAWVEARAQGDDAVLFDADFNEVSYQRYARQPRTHLRLLERAEQEGPEAAGRGDRLYGVARAGEVVRDITDQVRAHRRVWLVLSDAGRGAQARYARWFARGWRAGEGTQLRGIELRSFTRQ